MIISSSLAYVLCGLLPASRCWHDRSLDPGDDVLTLNKIAHLLRESVYLPQTICCIAAVMDAHRRDHGQRQCGLRLSHIKAGQGGQDLVSKAYDTLLLRSTGVAH
jgi:hypothetical protein